MRELVKDLENLKGDLTLNYKTIPVVYGEKVAKLMVVILVTINILITWYLVTTFDLGTMDYFFYLSVSLLSVVVVLVFLAQHQQQYMRIHILLKFFHFVQYLFHQILIHFLKIEVCLVL